MAKLSWDELCGYNIISAFAPFQDIWRQSSEIPEVSCTAHIALTARPSSRRKQSAHAVVISTPADLERSEKLQFLSPKLSSNNYISNLQNRSNFKSGNESSRLWRFFSRKKYPSLKKYLKSHQKANPMIENVSDIEISGFGTGNLPGVVMNDKNLLSECKSEPKWRHNEIKSNGSLPISRTSLTLALDMKPHRHSSQMPNLAHRQSSDYASNGVQWRSNIDEANAKVSFLVMLSLSIISKFH